VHWGVYEVFSVLAGASLVLLALPQRRPKEQFGLAAVGLAAIAHGVYVASRTSGYVFSVWIFVIPVAGAVYAASELLRRSGSRVQTSAPRTGSTSIRPARIEGMRKCVTASCDGRDVPTTQLRCDVCGAATQENTRPTIPPRSAVRPTPPPSPVLRTTMGPKGGARTSSVRHWQL
jgi:hypothetical protein